MEVLNLVVLLSVSLANLTIGLLSFLKNSRNLTHRLFALLTITLVGWSTANYVSVTAESPEIIFAAVKSILFFVVLQNTFFLLFVNAYPGNILEWKRYKLSAYLFFSFATLLLGIFPGYFDSYVIKGESTLPQASPVIALFMIHTVVSIGAGMSKLYSRYKHTRGLTHEQFKFLALAGSVLLLVAPFTNFALPTLFEITFFIPFSALYTLAFAVLVAYSMVKHRLLAFRLIVIKAFAYLLTLGLLALVYTVTIFGLSSLFFRFEEITARVQITYTLLALLLAFTLQPIKRFFDRMTSKFFYQDAYDAQAFLDRLNRVLVGNVELERLLQETSRVIGENLKADFCLFWVHETSYLPKRTISAWRYRLEEDDAEKIRTFISQSNHRLIVTDELRGDTKLYSLLQKNNVAVIAKIGTRLKGEAAGIGYIVLGQKKSGNVYNNEDIKLIEIITNELVLAIQNALRFEEIEHFNITLQEKVEEKTKELRRSNERLRMLDQTKDDFISMASHQLRTPLTSVKGYLSMVLEGDAGKLNEKEKKLLNQAFFSSQRMVYLIADLLNVSRLKTGKFIIEPTPVNLAEVIQGEVEQLIETAASRNLELTYKKPKDFPTLMFDETKIRQVIMNFTDNAVHYTPAGGHIQVILEETPSTVEFRVVDDGLGVPKQEQHHLFTKFYRAGNAKKARPDGTGLGLFMAKKVIVAQGGSIIFKSQEGKGSTFGFTFAKARLQPPTSVPKPAEAVAK